MAELKTTHGTTTASNVHVVPAVNKPSKPPKPDRNQIYKQPFPIRTYPLPNYYPSNPLSLLHIACAWLYQTVLKRPASEPATIYQGIWSPETKSVHVVGHVAVRALWEKGFFGKGNLSRSEPQWLQREEIRLGLAQGSVQEQVTSKRREERMRTKWERARLGHEAVEQTRLAEAQAAVEARRKSEPKPTTNGFHYANANGGLDRSARPPTSCPPVGPLELLQLPNSDAELRASLNGAFEATRPTAPKVNGIVREPYSALVAPVGPLELLRLPNSDVDLQAALSKDDGKGKRMERRLSGILRATSPCLSTEVSDETDDFTKPAAPQAGTHTNGTAHGKGADDGDRKEAGFTPAPLKRQKSVRFSNSVEETTFQLNDPPSPDQTAAPRDQPPEVESLPELSKTDIEDKEHLQLSPDEAFYLMFGIGALSVVDPVTQSELPALQLFDLFASYSCFPPRLLDTLKKDGATLRTDDPFLVQYVVYHHFRSLGWVPREGVKFGVDLILYRRGPVFDHAEFGLTIMPSYSDPGWNSEARQLERICSWDRLMGVQRTLSHVVKSTVLVYVDIPPPSALDVLSDAGPGGGIAGLLSRYKVREIMTRRWSSNRNR